MSTTQPASPSPTSRSRADVPTASEVLAVYGDTAKLVELVRPLDADQLASLVDVLAAEGPKALARTTIPVPAVVKAWVQAITDGTAHGDLGRTATAVVLRGGRDMPRERQSFASV